MKFKFFLFTLSFLSAISLFSCRDTQFEIINEGSDSGGITQSATVAGTVTDVLGQPISGVTIVTLPYGRAVDLDDIGRKAVENIVSDTQGNYQIDNLPQGTFKLLFLASGYIKGSLAIGPVDFNPANQVEEQIKKSMVLTVFPAFDDGDLPSVALFDPEDKKRMTEILTANGIRYSNIIGDLDSLNKVSFNVLVIGLDATVYQDVNELISKKNIIDNFLAEGGSIYLGQLNDFSVEELPMPFLTGDQQFSLHTENAPFNDFTSGKIMQASHPLVAGVSFINWSFVEAGQQTIKENVTFDAAIKNSFDQTNWNIIVTTPAEDFTSGSGTVTAEADVIIAEYTDPRSGANIVVNQAAFYQATFGDVTDENAILLTNNVVNYIKWLNRK
jgi:carboxypeptidase family protein